MKVTTKTLMATDRPRQLVSRANEMEKIRQALTKPGDSCQVVIIEGAGGLGKTRILEEVLRRIGQPDIRNIYGDPLSEHDWSDLQDQVIFCNLLDFTNIKLHTREYFLERLGDTRMWQDRIKFSRYKTANDRWRRLGDFGAAYTLLQSAAEAAEAAFWQDFHEAAQTWRLVISLDTTEQLAIISSQWLLDRGLLREEDLLFNTQQWLFQQIAAGKFRNTTFIIAGRDEEGKAFFDALKAAIAKAGPTCKQISIPLQVFSLSETEEYFRNLRKDWSTPPHSDSELASDVQPVLVNLMNNSEQMRVLWHYTGGQPVRLSLYTDILIEGQQIPAPLLESYDEAQARTGNDKMALQVARKEIEKAFVDLLFRSGGSLHAQILQTLVRTPRGLTAEQLDFVLNSKPEDRATTWKATPSQLEEIAAELMQIRTLSLVKERPGKRIGLQDEIYRIYAERMSDEEATRKEEMKSRRLLYARLSEWANARLEHLEKERETFIREDLARIRIERPSNILSTRLPQPSPVEQKRRSDITTSALDYRLEYLHYQLLIDPEIHFNDTYYKLVDERVNTYDEAGTAILQAEMWRVITDPYLLTFIEMRPRVVMQEWGETPKQVLVRAAQVDDATKWIVRLHLRRQYQAAIDLADRIDAAVNQLPHERERHAWNHTLARGDRNCWREFARTYSGRDVHDSIAALQTIVDRLKPLAETDTQTLVYDYEEGKEYGFVGHPALPRLRFLIGTIYTNLGYSYVSTGDFREAVRAYTTSLKYIRRLSISGFGLKATTRNNLSRALIEMGKKRSVRVCQDALELRIRDGYLLPIAMSYNTLALIWNDLRQPQEALMASARALAIAQFVQDPRAVGLSLLQVGEALRRLASSSNSYIADNSMEEIYREAARVLQQAHEIFSEPESPVSGEQLRRIEAAIELGSLYRDWVAYTPRDEVVPVEIRQQRLGDALYYLQEATDLAHGLGLNHLELDAQVNIGWTYYHVGQLEKTETVLQQAENTFIPTKAQLQETKIPPSPYDHPNFLFKQLSKMYSLRGQIAADRFNQGTEVLAQEEPLLSRQERQKKVHEDQGLQVFLQRAAIAFTKAVAYAQLFAPGSVQLTMVYDDLYEFLKKLNRQELADFYKYEQTACNALRTKEMRLENFGDVEEFLRDCFGDYYP
jgi:tetratricopeptide (TPR) repeat protein